jgi:hypothetical protein
MSGLLSRASCAATARQWGLQHYLQHSSSGSSNSSNRGSGMNNGQWSTDALAEMFEGVVGALLLDSDYRTVQQLLDPWVTESFDAARAASTAKLAAAAMTSDHAEKQQQQQHVQASSLVNAASSSSSSHHVQHQMATLLQEQLFQQCGYRFQNRDLAESCSAHVLQLVSSGSSNPQADTWHFIGFSLLQFAAAQHAYAEQCQQLHTPSSSMWQQLPWQQQRQAVVAAAAAGFDLSDCSTVSQASSVCGSWSSNGGSCDDDAFSSSSSSASSSSSSSVNQVHLMSKQMVNLTNIRHR